MKTNRKRRYCFSVITAFVLILCFTLTSCSIPGIFGIGKEEEHEAVGGDWRVWRSYGNDYVLSDEMTVCFSALDSGNGYAAYDADSGNRIGNLILPEPLSLDDIDSDEFEVTDYDGDGLNDISIITNDGSLIRYLFAPGDIGTWPDNIGGCFTCIDSETAETKEVIE